jgi:hypothetical protein
MRLLPPFFSMVRASAVIVVFAIIVVACESCGGGASTDGSTASASRQAQGQHVATAPAASASPPFEALPQAPAEPPPATPLPPTPTPVPRVPVVSLQRPQFGVDSQIEELGLIDGSQMDAPHDPYDTGWYPMWDWPGAPGNAIFAAHVNHYPGILGPFYNLASMGAGDEVQLTLADGEVLRYGVISNTRYDVSTIDMSHLIAAPERPPDDQWVTLVTCGGTFVPYANGSGAGYYLDRDVVVARRIS